MFLTLNAHRPIREDSILYATDYTHPIFNARAMDAQRRLWSLQGQRNTWFCGAYFGAGFHEDGLQAGLAVAEALGGCRRPWVVANESGRISIKEAAVDGRERPRSSRSPDGCLRSALFAGHVMHQRTRPKRHRLRYSVFYLALDLEEAPAVGAALRLFSVNRFNLFSFHERDHGDGSSLPLLEQVRAKLRAAALDAGGAIVLMTMPRMLGYAFNPLSIYFCYRNDGALAAILYEVNNTFGQRHSYLIPATADADGLVRQESAKSLYVSPFLDTDMSYAFVAAPPKERVAISITARDKEGPVLIARLSANRIPLADRTLLRALLAYPFLTLKVVAAIHWEALRLWLKGVRLTERPTQVTGRTTLGRASPCRRAPDRGCDPCRLLIGPPARSGVRAANSSNPWFDASSRTSTPAT